MENYRGRVAFEPEVFRSNHRIIENGYVRRNVEEAFWVPYVILTQNNSLLFVSWNDLIHGWFKNFKTRGVLQSCERKQCYCH